MFAWLTKKFPSRDPFVCQARLDQEKADYPGCREGLMACRSFCECTTGDIASQKWITKRAENLRVMAGCTHENTGPFRASMFPEFVMGRQCLKCRAVQKTGSSRWEVEN